MSGWLQGLAGAEPWLTGSPEQLLPRPNFTMPTRLQPTPEDEAAFVRRASGLGRMPARLGGPNGPSEEGPEAFGLNIVDPLAQFGFEMLVPQTPEDIALTLAFGPGLGRAARIGLGAAAGVAGFAGDAEGTLLNRTQVLRLRNRATPENLEPFSAQPTMRANIYRDMANGATETLGRAQQLASNSIEARPIMNPELYSPQDVNRAFMEFTPHLYDETGWIRYPTAMGGQYGDSVAHNLSDSWRNVTDMRRSFDTNIEPDARIWRSLGTDRFGQLSTEAHNIERPALATAATHQGGGLIDQLATSPMVEDALVVLAEPSIMRTTGHYYMPIADSYRGWANWFDPYNPQIGIAYDKYRATGPNSHIYRDQVNATTQHELQHILQSLGDNRPDTTHWESLAARAPESMMDEYKNLVQSLIAPNTPQDMLSLRAAQQQYLRHPLEWEARLAGEVVNSQRPEVWDAFRPVDFNRLGPWPDFRIW